jgi:hypothetical protein
MGDRANIIVKSGSERVCLYTHWAGSNLPKTLKSALKRGKSRWDDFQYLTRIIFCEMIGDDTKGLTGFGITQDIHDNENEILEVNIDNQTVNGISFINYIDQNEPS